MDVKVGTGAFMETPERAHELAKSIIGTAGKAGLRTHALITDMNEVLGSTAGNALEILESVNYLRNEYRERRLDEVVIGLCAEMLLIGGIEQERATAAQRCNEAVTSGKAAEVFAKMVTALGGPSDFMDKASSYLAEAPVTRPVSAVGIVTEVDTRAVGNAIIELGGGRREVGQQLDLSVGFSEFAPVGTEVGADRPLAIVHAASEADAEAAERNLLAAITLGDAQPAEHAVISEILTG